MLTSNLMVFNMVAECVSSSHSGTSGLSLMPQGFRLCGSCSHQEDLQRPLGVDT
jgi:hypothetical protein